MESISTDGLIVIGMVIVMIAGGFDLSVGAVMAMGGVAAIVLLPFSLPVALLVSLDESFLALSSGRPVPLTFVVLAITALVAHIMLTQRAWGRHVYAIGAGELAAAMSGLNTGRLKRQCYIISGALSGLAGVLLAARLGTGSPIIGEATPLIAAAAALIGGASLKGGEGSVAGAIAGLIFVGCLINVLNLLNMPSYYQRITIGGLLLLLVIVDGILMRLQRR
jgi:ribose/xylose/arabinose/galactoside ABC-type transport system permease subunit